MWLGLRGGSFLSQGVADLSMEQRLNQDLDVFAPVVYSAKNKRFNDAIIEDREKTMTHHSSAGTV
jgi:hypothetical protein